MVSKCVPKLVLPSFSPDGYLTYHTCVSCVPHFAQLFATLSLFFFTENHLKLFFAADFYHDDTRFSNIGLVIILPRNTNAEGAGDKLGKMSV